MKIFLLFTFVNLLIAQTIGQETSPSGARALPTNADVKQEDSSSSSAMEILMDHPIVKDAEKKCDKIKSDRSKNGNEGDYQPYRDLGDCIWGELGEEDRENITEFIEQKEKESKSETSYEGKDFGVGQVKATEEMQKMTEVITKKLTEGTYGKDEKDNIVAHGTYYQMAEQAFGKNLVMAVSHYCMNTDFSKKFFLFDESQPTQKQLEEDSSLKKDLPYYQQQWKKKLEENPDEASKYYGLCMIHIQDICFDNVTDVFIRSAKEKKIDTSKYEEFKKSRADHTQSFKYNDKDKKIKAYNVTSGENYCKQVVEGSAGEYQEGISANCMTKFRDSQKIACTIVRQMKETRSAMDSIKKIQDRFKKLAENNPGAIIANNEKMYESKGENSINSLTTFSSDELINADVEGALTAKLDRFKDCYDEDKEEVIGNTDKCKEFLDLNRTDKERLIAEYVLRRRTIENRMEKKFENKDEVLKAAMEQGYSEEEANELYDIEDGKFIKDQLQKRFAAESDAIHQQLIDKMNARTVKKDGEVQKTGDQQTLEEIHKELTSNVKRMKQLIRFNNIMSGFFEVGEGEQKKNNLVPLNIELATLKDDDRLKRSLENALPSLTDGSAEDEDGVVGFGAEEVGKLIDIKRTAPEEK